MLKRVMLQIAIGNCIGEPLRRFFKGGVHHINAVEIAKSSAVKKIKMTPAIAAQVKYDVVSVFRTRNNSV